MPATVFWCLVTHSRRLVALVRRVGAGFVMLWLAIAAVPVLAAPPLLAPVTSLDTLFERAGMLAQVQSVPSLAGSEVHHLQSSPDFSVTEAKAVRQALQPLREAAILQRLHDHVEASFTPQERARLSQIASHPLLQQWRSSEAFLREGDGREQWRRYRLQLREQPPVAARQALVSALLEARGDVAFALEIRVALRKQVLLALAHARTGNAVAEQALDAALQDYRQRLQEQMQRDSLEGGLFALRHVPTAQIQALLAQLRDPQYQRYLAVCRQALTVSFREAGRAVTSQELADSVP